MTAAPQPILDYASPRPRGRVRLPSRSDLDVRIEPDSVEVVERLAGKAWAIVAILFSASMFALMTVQAYGVLGGPRWYDYPLAFPALIILAVLVGGLWVMAAVINNTWRRTILIADADGIRLGFAAPLTGTRRHEWDADGIEAVRVEATEYGTVPADIELSRSGALAELQIHPKGGRAVAHLFTDHEGFRLVPIGEAVAAVIGINVSAPRVSPHVRIPPRPFGR